MTPRTIRFGVPAALLVALAAGVTLAQDWEKVEIAAQDLGGGVAMLTGQGGNLAVCHGEDGVLLVDDQFAPLTEKIRAAVAKLSPLPIRFVVNTHWHGDHTGGNENLGKAGALIVAHENVRVRMGSEQFQKAFDRKTPPAPKTALPVVTFAESVTFHWNGEEIRVVHVAPAHTDGDSVVRFVKSDVLHTGDLYFNGMYPFIDTSSGGSVDGVIAASERLLGMAGETTKIVPGHGPLSNRKELAAYRDMLRGVRDAVAKLLAEGKSLAEIVAAKPTAPWDAKWGGGFMKPDRFTAIVVESLKKD
jgi:glyoxylase-like metal-dependent hydrolase (beta-lactamase superfamily II)